MQANRNVKSSLVVPAVVLSALLTACGDGGAVAPTAPTGPSATPTILPPPAPAASGTITMIDSIPGAGASLLVGTCQFGTVTRRCADEWRGTFDVSASRGVDWPVLSVAFYDGDVLCGYAADAHQRLAAGATTTFRPARISLSDEFGTFSSSCPLPASITRVVAVLWSDSDWTFQLRREFATQYAFVER